MQAARGGTEHVSAAFVGGRRRLRQHLFGGGKSQHPVSLVNEPTRWCHVHVAEEHTYHLFSAAQGGTKRRCRCTANRQNSVFIFSPCPLRAPLSAFPKRTHTYTHVHTRPGKRFATKLLLNACRYCRCILFVEIVSYVYAMRL